MDFRVYTGMFCYNNVINKTIKSVCKALQLKDGHGGSRHEKTVVA